MSADRAWPAVLREGGVVLRPLRRSDVADWMAVRRDNAEWLAPWEATSPEPLHGPAPTFGQYVRTLQRQGRRGEALGNPAGGKLVQLAVEVLGQQFKFLVVHLVSRQSGWSGLIFCMSCFRARAIRLMMVPTGTPRISAASA